MEIEKIIDIAKKRGFFWPSSEIYSNFIAGFYNYGPLGVNLKRKIENMWREFFIKNEGFYEIEGTNIMPEKVFVASGHIKSFADPLVQCKKCKSLHRADKLIENETGIFVPERTPLEKIDQIIKEKNIKCPNCKGELDKTRFFNMMFKLRMGATEEDVAYLRPETCQAIFVDFLNVYRSMRAKLPFGMAQIGKSFRNEISPRQGLLRQREFTQAEAEIFFDPQKDFSIPKELEKYELNLQMVKDKEVKKIKVSDIIRKNIIKEKLVVYHLAKFQQFINSLGIPLEAIRLREHTDEERPFYAKYAFDCEVKTSIGWIEIAANHYRTDYDLSSHSKVSGTDLSVLEDGKKFIPHVWEISQGIDRTLMVVMMHAYRDDKERGWEWFDLIPTIAPFVAAVYPLVSKDGLPEKAEEVYNSLKECFDVFYDESGSIGKRYARADEIGTLIAVTVDHQTLEDDTVTIRDRDSTKQIRVKIKDLKDVLWKILNGENFEKMKN